MDHYQRSARNTFTALNLDRQSELREDSEWLQRQLNSQHARFLPVYNGACLVADASQPDAPLLLKDNPVKDQPTVFLGQSQSGSSLMHNVFSVELPDRHPLLSNENQQIGLRRAASLFSSEHAGLCAYALAIHQWHDNHQFCGRCGSKNQIVAAGHRLQCASKDCKHTAFPRIDPAMICLLYTSPSPRDKRQSRMPSSA